MNKPSKCKNCEWYGKPYWSVINPCDNCCREEKINIFIDTEDIEERYGEELYKDYLEKQVKDYKSRIEKAVEYIENEDIDVCTIRYNDIYDTKKELLDILNGRSDELKEVSKDERI